MVEQYRATGASKSITLRPGMARHQSKETNTFRTSYAEILVNNNLRDIAMSRLSPGKYRW